MRDAQAQLTPSAGGDDSHVPAPLPDLARVLSVEAYREARAHVFQAEAQLQWFIRSRRAGLVRGGAVLMITGRLMIDPTRFDDFVLRDGAAVLQRRLDRKSEVLET